ncbi:hypothetical protein ATPR_1485 [Acetobacter tropicalis NBRC 101654]|uniref:Uncharacterized protein n=1 Tax=Acetobacter tropicalis NBRC 101654 TaxID=749388 RepID=F7VDN6_9PROT|nr:hypothetical protein ATPR_1485 [Acetobacter tropicalis NBRC 101654]
MSLTCGFFHILTARSRNIFKISLNSEHISRYQADMRKKPLLLCPKTGTVILVTQWMDLHQPVLPQP